jgi:GrpB-like predicted nucleotidyltransferase (UPF0157 family)
MNTVILLDPQPEWPHHFRDAAAHLYTAFADTPIHVEHIGSTAVPKLCAKPILDILLGATNLSSITSKISQLGALGYRYKPEHERELPERRYFSRPATDTPAVHLHAVVHGSPIWHRHLAFRDALRSNPELTHQYAELKRRLATLHADDRAAYTDAKGPFIAQVLATLDADRLRQ